MSQERGGPIHTWQENRTSQAEGLSAYEETYRSFWSFFLAAGLRLAT